jgi:membrane-bound lytic murein transglycosylase A
MKLSPLFAAAGSVFFIAACRTAPDYGRPLPAGAPALIELKEGEKRPDFAEGWKNRSDVLAALERSMTWTRAEHARQFFPIEGVTQERAMRSLEHMKTLLLECTSAEEFDERINESFNVYKSAGWNGHGGGVLFTGYCTPILEGQTKRDATYCYPLYSLPPDLLKGDQGEILGQKTAMGVEPYPTRRAIEASGMLEGKNLELVWLKDPLDAFIAHVNGSAFVKTPDGEMLRFGYAGKNGREYRSLGKELVKDKQLSASEVSLARIRQWGREHPAELVRYLQRNDSYVFFTPIDGNPRGSLNVEVAAGRSLATDKTLFPRGAVVFVDTKLAAQGEESFHQFMFDQDTGGAIRTAGRADIYLGVGPDAERIAGRTQAEGQLYYLFLKPEMMEKIRAERSRLGP